jgi:molybdopterin-biosynthesis enzyme MoeA-like protein
MRGEGDVAAPLAQIAADHPDLSLGSYPFQKDGAYGTNIVIRGTDQTRVAAAMAQLQALFPA